ncbi:MAG: hypothetical protein ACE5JG_06510, partial [Planctomycetota bacterium]
RRLREAETPEACLELAEWCRGHKLKGERWVALERGLRLDPEHAAVRKQLGSRAPKRDPLADLRRARRLLEEEDPAERTDILEGLSRERGFPYPREYLLRALRSKTLGTGLAEDRPLTLRADKIARPVYFTIHVSTRYDPLVPTPLVVGLHGGGPGGKDGKEVVGTGKSAMNFYRGECEQRGWICVCPNAVVAGWHSRPNHDVIDAVLDELRALYNIDENRIYLTGHSMGGGEPGRRGSG